MSIILLCSTLLPSVSVSAAFTPKFALHSEGVYMVNLDTDIVIVSKNADKKLTPASTTKIHDRSGCFGEHQGFQRESRC